MKPGGIFRQGFRFLVAGGLNTLFSLAVYQVALLFLPHELAYATCWIAGLGFLVVVYPGRVFGVPDSSWRQKALVVALYIGSFAAGLCLLELLVRQQVQPQWAIFVVLVLTTAINFAGMRGILGGRS